MKKIISLLSIVLFSAIISAQTLIINVSQAGGLSTAITTAGGNASNITNLTVTGNIDARDVKFMRDNMPVLSVLDLEAVHIVAYTGTEGTMEESSTYPANEMPQNSFYRRDETTIPPTIVEQTLTTIKFPADLEVIGEGAFKFCINLTDTINIPNGVITICKKAFRNCENLSGISFPLSLESIESGSFGSCNSLIELRLSDSLKSIGFQAFDGCRSLMGTLKIPDGITVIQDLSFQSCSFTGLILPDKLESIEYDAFYKCTELKGDLIIPNSVKKIDRGFRWCTGLTSCYLPPSLTSMTGAFYSCSGLKKIVVDNINPVITDTYTFNSVNKDSCELIVPMGSKSAYESTAGWQLFTNITEALFVRLNVQGGQPVAPITTIYANSTISEPAVPIRKGYTFVGWYKEPDCINAWDFDTDIVTEPITLYAKWTEETNDDTVTDIDSNIYNTVTIGTQVWMNENLKTTKYNDGTQIPKVTDNDEWYGLTSPAYCWYNNDSVSYKAEYGALYNWYTANTNKLCPTGWHVPSYSEWEELENFLGDDVAANKLKEAGNTHWLYMNTEATNGSEFTALPGGYRSSNFLNINRVGYWWLATPTDYNKAFARGMDDHKDYVLHNAEELLCGLSVRCIKDNSSTSIGNVTDSEIKVYPNPAKNTLYIKGKSKTEVVISIFNLQGRQVLLDIVTTNSMDVSHLPKGIYTVQLIADGNSFVTKLIKE